MNTTDLITFLRLKGRLGRLLTEATAEAIILQAAEAAGGSIDDSNLQQAADRFRYRNGLMTAVQMQQWLDSHGLSAEDFEHSIERELLIEKFKDQLAEEHTEQHFSENASRYASVQLRQILVASEGIAQELLTKLQEEGKEFAELAREYSQDISFREGGKIGSVPRYALPENIALAIFQGEVGTVVGPIASDQGVHLFLIEAIMEPTLDDATRSVIRSEIYSNWLQEQLKDVRIDLSALSSSA